MDHGRKQRIFIDGSAGTTGLHILQRLQERDDIALITLPEELRKDDGARKEALNRADIAILCLPNEAAVQAAEMVENDRTSLIDTSSSHRTEPGWEYGFPELKGRREAIRQSRRIANPGCHASGFVALVEPLVRAGVLPKDVRLSCFSLTGYSSNGKKVISYYESPERSPLLSGARLYALDQQHKHLKEMCGICGLIHKPVLCPVLNPYYSGIEVIVPLFAAELGLSRKSVGELYRSYYTDGVVRFVEDQTERGYLSSVALSGRDDMEITVQGNDERILLIARYDNLGKGACGAAIQNLNLLLGVDECTGLVTRPPTEAY